MVRKRSLHPAEHIIHARAVYARDLNGVWHLIFRVARFRALSRRRAVCALALKGDKERTREREGLEYVMRAGACRG